MQGIVVGNAGYRCCISLCASSVRGPALTLMWKIHFISEYGNEKFYTDALMLLVRHLCSVVLLPDLTEITGLQ